MKRIIQLASVASCLSGAAFAETLTISEQGSYAVGGTMVQAPGTYDNNNPTVSGQSLHGDHLYVAYQIPVEPRPLPLIMMHGNFQSGRSWEETPDGREGFQTIFLRRQFPVYIIDQPRRGRAGNSTVAATAEPTPNDQLFFDQFRLGIWPNLYENVAFDPSPEALDQFFRSVTPNTGPYDPTVIVASVSSLVERIGPSVLMTHSQAGGPGWLTAIANPDVRGIVALEPGSGFVFPEGEMPEPMPSAAGTLSPESVSMEDFQKLTQLPIVIYYGDNIPAEPTELRGQDNWRVRVDMAALWVEAINRHGGNAKLVLLPEVGLTGNTHFPMSDTNNVQFADQISAFLAENDLD